MADPRVAKFAKVLVEHSTRIVPGDRVLIEATTAAEPLVRELIIQILQKGGHPHPLIMLPDFNYPDHEELLLTYGNDVQLGFVPSFFKLAYDQFESRIRIHSATNP
ncbi:MAG TPA: aminopeptidase, partial [Terriglobales bacterium]|nr:aminopeptidase [Terriglobales bacterium]